MPGLLSAVSNVDRLRQIAQVLVKHGFGELLARTELGQLVPRRGKGEGEGEAGAGAAPVATPARFRLALQELGPSFIKLGQIASTRADLLPPDWIEELKKLQEEVPPVAFDAVKREIEETAGATLDEIFESFDERPLASASIGQVHRALLRPPASTAGGSADAAPGGDTSADAAPAVPSGDARGDAPRDVAVKVQRPNIRGTIERDLELLHLMARLLERAVPESRIYSPTGLVAEFDRAITAELDYTIEAQNAEKFTRHFEGNPHVRFPRVHHETSGKRVLVQEFFDGHKIEEAVARGFSGELIARNAVGIVCKMIFEDGLFHADPHPGNIRILGTPEAPVIGLLDLGLVGTLGPDMRDKATDLMIAAVRKDTELLADALLALGRPRGKVDREVFRAHVARVSGAHLGRPLREIQLAAMVRDLVEGAVKFDIEMPSEMMMVGKALMTVEGIGKSIHPELDVFAEARPFFLRLLAQRYSPERVGAKLFRTATRLSGAVSDLPPLLSEVLDDLRRGRLRLATEDAPRARAIDRLGRRVALGLLGAGALGSGTALLLGGQPHAAVALFASAAAAAFLAWR